MFVNYQTNFSLSHVGIKFISSFVVKERPAMAIYRPPVARQDRNKVKGIKNFTVFVQGFFIYYKHLAAFVSAFVCINN